MRILLVQPAPFEAGRIGLENALWLSEPAALTAVAAMVEDEHEVTILDMRLEEADQLPRALAALRPDLVGVTCMTTDAYQAQAVLHCAKSILGPRVFTVMGGHHPTLCPEEHDLPEIDAIVMGGVRTVPLGSRDAPEVAGPPHIPSHPPTSPPRPLLGAVPQLDVPPVLPDLLNVADVRDLAM